MIEPYEKGPDMRSLKSVACCAPLPTTFSVRSTSECESTRSSELARLEGLGPGLMIIMLMVRVMLMMMLMMMMMRR